MCYPTGEQAEDQPASPQHATVSVQVSQSRPIGWMGTGPQSWWHQLLGTRINSGLGIFWYKFGLVSPWRRGFLGSVPASLEAGLDVQCVSEDEQWEKDGSDPWIREGSDGILAILAGLYWSRNFELLAAVSTTFPPSLPTFIGNVGFSMGFSFYFYLHR